VRNVENIEKEMMEEAFSRYITSMVIGEIIIREI
jgi:hypothetical protein